MIAFVGSGRNDSMEHVDLLCKSGVWPPLSPYENSLKISIPTLPLKQMSIQTLPTQIVLMCSKAYSVWYIHITDPVGFPPNVIDRGVVVFVYGLVQIKGTVKLFSFVIERRS